MSGIGESDRCHVVVAGGGPAGIGAAWAAARSGARVLLLEASNTLGGTAERALWMPTNRLFIDGAPRGGVCDALVTEVKALGPEAWRQGKRTRTDGDGLDIHPEYQQLALFTLLEKAGCRYRLFSPVTEVEMEGRRVSAVAVAAKARGRYSASVFIDASGDGDLAALAGVETVNGREEDGIHMPVALVFAIGGLETEKFLAWMKDNNDAFKKILIEAKKEGRVLAAWYAFDETTLPGVLSVNNGGIADIGIIDGTSSRELTLVERLGIEVAVEFVRLLRERKVPGAERCVLVRAGSRAAVRDTRRIKGEYIVTVEDARTGTPFPDAVARKYGAIDANQIFIGEMQSGFSYPYRALLPRNVDNLLVAGRCGSATFLGHAAGKSQGNMMEVGQAAGVAAALAARGNQNPRHVPAEDIREVLRGWNVAIPGAPRP